jgi:hypothetical protein
VQLVAAKATAFTKARWTNLPNGEHEEYSFVSGRGADKKPAFTHHSENEIEHESDFIGRRPSRVGRFGNNGGATRPAF